jgi:DNA-binding NtrC family response regulator
MARVVILEADPTWQAILADALTASHQLEVSADERQLVADLQKVLADAVIVNVAEDTGRALALVSKIGSVAPHVPIIVTSVSEKADFIVQVMRQGACDFIAKPYGRERIRLSVDQALERRTLRNEIDYLRRQQDVVYDLERIVAVSPCMREVVATVRKLANTDATILMTGETGTGKSFFAGTIHFNSHRRQRPFVVINCANISETLLESELFGHEKGAFTGATKTRAGRFEQANEGTVFLDEIGEMSLSLQAKLLRVLEEKAFERVGGNQTIRSNVRLIAATNRDLEGLVARGAFREDLYYRIHVLHLHLPPLRERHECIEPLATYLLRRICTNVKKRIVGFAPEVLELFGHHEWPGNIRQLSNVIERAVLMEEGEVLGLESIALPRVAVPPAAKADHRRQEASFQPLADQERESILLALENSLWVQKDAARLLGITPRCLNYKIKKIGITHHRWLKNR